MNEQRCTCGHYKINHIGGISYCGVVPCPCVLYEPADGNPASEAKPADATVGAQRKDPNATSPAGSSAVEAATTLTGLTLHQAATIMTFNKEEATRQYERAERAEALCQEQQQEIARLKAEAQRFPAYLSKDYQRMWDLVRQQRAELSEAGLITASEYAQLSLDETANKPGQGSPSPRRLESYDELRQRAEVLERERDALRAQIERETNKDSGAGLIGQPIPDMAGTEPRPNSTRFLDWIDIEAMRQLLRPRQAPTNAPLDDELWWQEWKALRARIEAQVGSHGNP